MRKREARWEKIGGKWRHASRHKGRHRGADRDAKGGTREAQRNRGRQKGGKWAATGRHQGRQTGMQIDARGGKGHQGHGSIDCGGSLAVSAIGLGNVDAGLQVNIC